MRDSMTPKQHERFFFEFIKNSGVFNFQYSDKKIKKQKVIALMDTDEVDGKLEICDKLEKEGYAVIDPNWDDLYNSFINIDHNRDSVEYIKNLVDTTSAIDVIEGVVKKFIQSNIISDTVYVVTSARWKAEWADEIVEV